LGRPLHADAIDAEVFAADAASFVGVDFDFADSVDVLAELAAPEVSANSFKFPGGLGVCWFGGVGGALFVGSSL